MSEVKLALRRGIKLALLEHAEQVGVAPGALLSQIIDAGIDAAEAAMADVDAAAPRMTEPREAHCVGHLVLVFLGGVFAGISLAVRDDDGCGDRVEMCDWFTRARRRHPARSRADH